MRRTLLLALAIVTASVPAVAQTAGPTPGEIVGKQIADQNRFQVQLQANQLQQLQQRNNVDLQTANPGLQADALVRRQQIQQEIDQNTALQQRMSTPSSNPDDVRARLQQNGVRIQDLQQQTPVPVR
jgi:hypothetical protein